VGELVREIAPLVTGLTLREVLPRPPRDVLLDFVSSADPDGPPAWRLLISGDGDAPRIHVWRGRFERHQGPLGPFYRRLISDLAGLQVRALTQVAGDRIVALELRGTETRTLIAELVGRHSNLVLLGPGDKVLDVLVPAPPAKPTAEKREPRLVLGGVYVPPPGRAVKPGAEGQPLAESLPAPNEPAPLRRSESSNPAPLSWIVERALGGVADDAREGRDRRELVERLERKRKNARSLVHGLEQRLEASAQAERVQQDGELVKASLSRIARGARSIEVEDFFAEDGGARTIALDPKLSPHENLERIFERAKKLERARSVVGDELLMARTKLASIETFLARAQPEGVDFDALALEAVAARVLEPQQPAPAGKKPVVAARVPYKTFHGVAGGEIRVGRNARDNDDLTFHHARGNDVWLHTADAPGRARSRTPKSCSTPRTWPCTFRRTRTRPKRASTSRAARRCTSRAGPNPAS
jgi:predicted ribosome quality control (RQC) complex YloA/Tae2 family protein